MMKLYQLQGRTGCADTLINPMTANRAVSSRLNCRRPPRRSRRRRAKRQLRSQFSRRRRPYSGHRADRPPQNDFDLISVTTTHCSTTLSGVITVEVYDSDGTTGLPGKEIRARWDTGESHFFTGLKPEKSPAYADFQMETGKDYIIDMPGHADPVPQPLSAVPCTTPTNERAIISYRVLFRAN